MTRETGLDLTKELGAFGAAASEILFLNAADHRLINYLDLVPTRGNAHGLPCPDAVVELDGSPLVYVLRTDLLSHSPDLQRQQIYTLHKLLSCRGDARYLTIVRPGEVTLFPLGLSIDLPEGVAITHADVGAGALFRDLAMGLQPELAPRKGTGRRGGPVRGEAVHDLLSKLLGQVTRDLLNTALLKEKKEDVLSLVGRALFTRFLIDRGIINEKTFPSLYSPEGQTPERCFDTPDLAAMTCGWLDDKFNGELLPLPDTNYRRYFRSLATDGNAVFGALSKILFRTTPEGQLHLDWNDINFGHVPVGLLSQVYERYAHEFFEDLAKKESIVYTPRHIAEYMVGQSFPGIKTSPPHEAKVLDPAAGAGVFLVLCFRRLVAERWKATGKRPDTRQIRAILNKQIRGFDINSSALKLAALSLYLTALELDPNPFPPTKLRFDKLMGNVLFHTRLPGEEHPHFPVLGSLGPAIGQEHSGIYDLVIGNPPWTAWEGKGSDIVAQSVQRIIREIASKRGGGGANERLDDDLNPDKVPDLPFVWRAMEWAKTDGSISFVLHGRLLFKHSDRGSHARDALFRAFRVTGILNAAALTGHKDIWENMNQPFCLCFGRNTVPRTEDLFHFVSPEREEGVNRQSRIRVDYQSAQPIQFSVLSERPSLLKILYTGTSLDVDVIEIISRPQAGGHPMVRLGDYWTLSNGLFGGQGFQVVNTDKGSANSAHFLKEMGARYLNKHMATGFVLDASGLPEFAFDNLHRPRAKELFLPPLVLISKSPGENRDCIRARLSLSPTPIAYNESFFGYSSHDHKDREAIARYLFLLANSDLFVYHLLMTSAEFGVERRAIQEDDIADFPIIPFENLSSEQLRQVVRISAQFDSPTSVVWNSLNEFVSTLYGLSRPDREVISDTLRTRMPYVVVRRAAETPPNQGQVEEFRSRLEDVLRPYFDLTHESIVVKIREKQPSRTWLFLDVISSACKVASLNVDLMACLAEKLAERTGSSRIMIPVAEGHLCIGILAQYRYWTRTRARLCAMDILREHGNVFRVRTQ